MKFKFIAVPRIGRLEQITSWLREESKNGGCGFYCNITVINKAFVDKEVVCVTARNEAIGFAVITRRTYTARIDIAEICPAYRGTGAGRFLVENCLQELAKSNVRVVDLECAPKSSEGFWQHMEFNRVPEEILKNYSQYNKPIIMFRPTCPTQSQKSPHYTLEYTIELFDCEPWACGRREPKWSWPILILDDTGLLVKPVIHPAQMDWCVRLKKEDQIIKVDKVKHFCDGSFSYGNYLILTQLPPVS